MQTRPLAPATLGLRGRQDLHLTGELPPPPRLAVVGSRAAHRRYREAVPLLVEAAGAEGWSIVSGGAIGIDGDAHEAALAAGVPQLAVLPCGPDRIYPPQHGPLCRRIAAAPGSGLLFAHAAGTVPARAMFASRNAIVVGLCDAVVVVEATPRSGTMITAELARRKARARAVVVGSPGAAVLATAGAHPLPWGERGQPQALREEAVAWLRALARGEPPPPPAEVPWPEHLAWLRAAVQEAGPAGLLLDSLASPRTALMALAEAEGLGLVVERAAGRWALAAG